MQEPTSHADASAEATAAAPPPQDVPGAGEAGDPAQRMREENEQLRRQVQSLRERPVASDRSVGHRIRAVVTPVLILLTSVSVVAATVGVWMNRTIWNTDRYVALVAPLADDPAVTDALASKLTVSAVEALDLEARVQNALSQIPQLPEAARFLAGPITAGAQDLIQRRVETFLASQTFKDLWVELNRRAHEKVLALLNGDLSQLPSVSTAGGEVRLNLVSVVAIVLQRVVQGGINGLNLNVTVPTIPVGEEASASIQRLGQSLGVTLPPDFGQVTIMTESQLATYQQAAHSLKVLGWALVLLVVVLMGLTLVVSVRRRRTVMWLGVGSVAALFVAYVFIRRIKESVLNGITGSGARAAVRNVFGQVGGSLRSLGLIVVVAALLLALGAYLAGRPRWLTAAFRRVRRFTTTQDGGRAWRVWLARHADAVWIASIAIAILVLFVTGIDWVPVAVVGAVLALVRWQISAARRTVAEDPIQASSPEERREAQGPPFGPRPATPTPQL